MSNSLHLTVDCPYCGVGVERLFFPLPEISEKVSFRGKREVTIPYVLEVCLTVDCSSCGGTFAVKLGGGLSFEIKTAKLEWCYEASS